MCLKLGLIGFVLAVEAGFWGGNWVCFSRLAKCPIFHIYFSCKRLRSFDFFGNWVCFA
jgi:hypothetical protein